LGWPSSNCEIHIYSIVYGCQKAALEEKAMNKDIKTFFAIDKMLEKKEYYWCYQAIQTNANTQFPLTTRSRDSDDALRQFYYDQCCKGKCMIVQCPLGKTIRSRLMKGV
jgi:hypothetical protein